MITEDAIVTWVKERGHILHTRKYSNIDKISNYKDNKNLIVCITGYPNIIKHFFSQIITNFNHPIVLITLETDGFEIKKEYLDSPNLKKWFTWNKPMKHDKLAALPIGLNYDRHYSMITKYLERNKEYNPSKLLLVNFDENTNSIRKKLIQKAKNGLEKIFYN